METIDAENTLMDYLGTRNADTEHKVLVAIGSVIDSWKVVALLGRGGFADVYRVQHTHFANTAAMKICRSDEEKSVERFKREREFLQIQALECFPRFVDKGDWSARPYLVMEELEPVELPHKESAVTKFMMEICKAVAKLHAEGLVHRDLKPGNIMRRKDGTYVLIDLGLVKQIDRAAGTSVKRDSLSIVDGHKVVVGTPGFSAPEQFISGEANESSDVHALGMLVNECFDGKPPKSWLHLIEKATTSITAQRFKTVQELMRGIASISSVRPFAVKLMLAVSLIPLAFCLVWTPSRALYMHYQLGISAYEIGRTFLTYMLVFGVFESIVPSLLFFRRNLSPLEVTRLLGVIPILYMVLLECFGKGITSVCMRDAITQLVAFVPITFAAIISFVPSVLRWYKRQIEE